MEYSEFIKTKNASLSFPGIKAKGLNVSLKDFQKFSVTIALDKGRFALFEDCGLGKTFQQLEFGRHVANHTGKPFLALAPLAVVGQTINEGKKFGIDVQEAAYGSTKAGIYITNYEQLHNIDPTVYGGICLDESSILKNFEGAYRNLIIDNFRHTPFKLSCSATPSPNDPMELGNQAEFLGVMNRQEMLATYFTHDGGETAKWRLKGHAESNFWRWVNTWSLMFSKPSDIGFNDEGYVLPELNFIEKKIATELRGSNLFNQMATSASDFHKEVRLTRSSRVSEVLEIVNNSTESFIVWVEHNDEGDQLKRLIPGSIQVKGSDTDTFKKDRLLGFANNEFRVLITKTKIASLGLNYQNCHNQVFTSPDHSFEKIYQAIRRSLRYGQKHVVNAYLITTDTMQNVIQSFNRKQAQHLNMHKQLNKHTRELYEQYYQAA